MIEGRLAWGLLGTARINAAVIPPIRSARRSVLAAVASRDARKALAYAETWSIAKALGSYEELLADPDIDVVYVSLPNSLHAEWSIKALKAGKNVLCEKPMALSADEMDALERAARDSGRVLAEAFMYRHHPQTILVRRLVEEGRIGSLQSMRGSFTFNISSETDIRLDAARAGGSLRDVGCYPVSLGRLIAGAEPVEAFGSAVMGKGGVDEAFCGQLRFASGCVLQFDSGFRSPTRMRFEISGSEGTLVVESPFKPQPHDRVILRREDRLETIEVAPFDLYSGEIADMEACVLDQRSQGMGLADSRGNAAAICALLESARSGRAVRL